MFLGLEYSEVAFQYCARRNLKVDKFNLEEDALTLNRTFDVAVTLEVAELLPPGAAEHYVDTLTKLSKIIVFTAAPPGQGGTDHVNEQPPAYWITKFRRRKFEFDQEMTDRWRNAWLKSGKVEHWYHQNLMIFRK